MKVFPINARPFTEDYPYGRLRAKATFGVEFKKNKGYRSFFQTINPKNGRINAPKNGTYNDFMCIILNEETGHYEHQGFHVRGYKDVNDVCKFISENLEDLELSDLQVTELFAHLHRVVKSNLAYTKLEKRQEDEKILKPVLLNLTFGFINGDSKVFEKINIDLTKISE